VDEFETFVRDVGPTLSRVAYLLTGDHAQAEDLTQVTLWKAHRSWGRILGADNRSAYLRRMMLNEHLSWRRRLWTTELVAPRHVLESASIRSVPDHGDAVAASDIVRRMLDQLPRRQRAVLVMRYYLDLPDDQIAAELGCTLSTVRSLAARALKSLRSSHVLREEDIHERG
jgi:RNA polymerase sigma-70 factor (sigma-E family)